MSVLWWILLAVIWIAIVLARPRSRAMAVAERSGVACGWHRPRRGQRVGRRRPLGAMPGS